MWGQSLPVMNIQFQNSSCPPWAHLPVGIDVFEAVLEHISFELAKNFCDSSLGTIYVGECENVLFSLVMPTERTAWQLLWQYYQPLHICTLRALLFIDVLFCMHQSWGTAPHDIFPWYLSHLQPMMLQIHKTMATAVVTMHLTQQI